MTAQKKQHICIALTGASGICITYRLIEKLLTQDIQISLVYSEAAESVSAQETAIPLTKNVTETEQHLLTYFQTNSEQLRIYSRTDWYAPIASGSNTADAMVICPCTMSTAAAVAHGLSDNLLTRAADVMIKEQKPLILVPRESPLSAIHLENLLKLGRLHVTILPPMMTFYHQPASINDMIDHTVERILDHLHLSHDNAYRWGKPHNK